MTNRLQRIRGKRLHGAAAAIVACGGLLATGLSTESAETDPSPENPNLGFAIRAIEDGQPDRAAKELETLISGEGLSESSRRKAQLLLLEAYVRNGHPEKALGLPLKDTSSESSGANFWRAQAFATTGDYDNAAALIEAVDPGEDDPFRPEIIYLRSILLEHRNDIDGAIDILYPLFEPTADVRAASIGHLRTAEIRYREGLFLEALDQLAAMSRTSVSVDTRATYLRGRIYLAQGQWEAAEQSLSSVVNYASNPEPRLLQIAHIALADAYSGMGSNQKSEQVLKSFIEKFPGTPILATSF